MVCESARRAAAVAAMEESPGSETRPNEWIEMDGEAEDGSTGKQSRFHVAKVDFASDNPLLGEAGGDAGDEDTIAAASPNQTSHQSGSTAYDTHYMKSLRHMTREALPRIDHYRNVLSVHAANRPTLEELHGDTAVEGKTSHEDKIKKTEETAGVVKFGWIRGVFIRCLLNIWGVMLFLRLSWVVGQAGILEATVIVLLACVVTILTSLSAAAICTNGMVKGGGTYYMISRSLGPEFGGSIGLIFSFANIVAVAMYVVGFCESFTDMLESLDLSIVGNKLHDIRIIGTITLICLLGITVVGMEWEARAQIVLLIILLLAMVDFVIGSFIPPQTDEIVKGFVGYNFQTLKDNFLSDYRQGHTFFSVFSVFFPAATGILAGANISGDLADPSKAIPQGTLLAIVVTTISYIGFGVMAGSCVVREADGDEMHLEGDEWKNCRFANETCKFGLLNNFQVMELVSIFGPIIYAGCFAATLSSALASLVSAPKVFQALCKDKLYPYIHVFGKGYGKNNEPLRGYALTFVIALAFILIAELNAIAPIISNFFLASYCLVNYSCFHASLAKSPGFRPGFRYYNMWVSLLGAILCLVVMFIINWWTALLTFAICFTLYMYISHAKPDVNWGSSTQAQTYRSALQTVIKLNSVEEHVKNYRPQILVLSGFPSSRPPLVDFANNITKNLSLLMCGHVIQRQVNQRVRNSYYKHAYAWLQRRKVKGFYCLVDDNHLAHGARSLMQTSGVGKLKPNTVLLGFKSDWQNCEPNELQDYFTIIHDAFDNYLAVGILRLQQGLDYGQFLEETTAIAIMTPALLAPPLPNLSASIDSNIHLRYNVSSSQLSTGGSSTEPSPPSTPVSGQRPVSLSPKGTEKKRSVQPNESSTQLMKGSVRDVPREVLTALNQFQRKQKKGTIDVWWLYDDGGLTMLIPYILTTRKQWHSCKLRVFALANRKDELDEEQRNLASLLSKFRIDYSDVIVIPDVQKKPQENSVQEFEAIIKKFHEKEVGSGDTVITEAELLALKDRTMRHIRLRELLQRHSLDATLIVMTLPMPRKGTVSAPLYLAWLDTLTRDLPPFLLLRGNQTNVITFYS